MATGLDRFFGLLMVSLSVFLFIYYTVWAIILPFVDDSQIIHRFFLPRIYAVIGPIILAVIGIFGLGMFVTVIMIKNKKQKSN